MKKWLLFILLIATHYSFAQNWQCLQSGVKNYFINGNGYLRGIRIDSVITSGDTTIYYPFHTPRGSYNTAAYLDSNGGSWLGKRVAACNDGTFLFDNLWHDTVVIKSNANTGDSWVFYSDTTALYYLASVTAVDTMSVLGLPDSIKKITINAYNSSGLVSYDSANGFQIILSKNHGFVQVFDLYTFPYHQTGSAYSTGIDLYLDKCTYSLINIFSPYIIPTSAAPSANTAIFKLIRFDNISHAQLYDWNVGDVYEYSECISYISRLTNLCDPPMQIELDSIQTKTISSANTTYGFSGLLSAMDYPMANIYPYTYHTGGNSGTYVYDNAPILDTALMPEEHKQTSFYIYLPDDTGYCLHSPLFVSMDNQIIHDQYYPPFEFFGPVVIYKYQIGLIESYSVSLDAGYGVSDQKLIYYYRSGQGCGTLSTVAVPEVSKGSHYITMNPNPASSELTITSSNKITDLVITNILGQIVYTQKSDTNKEQVNIEKLQPGMYFVCVNGIEVRKFVKQ